MFSRSHPIILFIDRSGLNLYQDTLPNIPRFNFTQDIVFNIDVVNKSQFSSLLATFIQINKIAPSSLAIILSDSIIYEKDLADFSQKPIAQVQTAQSALSQGGLGVRDGADKEHKEEIQSFIDNVPFEEVLVKVIKTDPVNRIVAVNKDLVMTISDALTNKGSFLEAVIPAFMYGPGVNFTQGVTMENVQAILGRSEVLRLGNLLTNQEKFIPLTKTEEEPKEKKKPQNLRQNILLGVFAALIIILVVVYLNMGSAPTPAPQKSLQSLGSAPEGRASTPSISQTQIPSPTVAVDLKNIVVKITHDVQGASTAGILRSNLQKAGLTDVENQVSADTVPEKSSLSFSGDIPFQLRDAAIAEIRRVLPDISILENGEENLTITILLGKS